METFRPPSCLRLDSNNLEEEWKFWEQKFDLYLNASGASEKSEVTQIAIFLHCIGDDALKVFNAFQFASEDDKKQLKVIKEKFKDYCTPCKNIVFERFNFWRLTQAPGESWIRL